MISVMYVRKRKPMYLVGIDEVGRGPIAGPVAVCAFMFLKPEARRLFRGVKESKQLSERKREEWFARIKSAQESRHINFCVIFQNERVIDTKGLSYAIRTALSTSLNKLKNALKIKTHHIKVLLDGGLKAPAEYINQKTTIRGDEKEIIIALASICAKVLRDRKMNLLGEKHLKYGFERHKGYGTKAHYWAIKKYGMLRVHRRSFLKNVSY